MKRLALFAILAATAGCSTDQIARVVYYSFRVQNQAVDNTPPMQPPSEPIPYDRYQQERRGETSR